MRGETNTQAALNMMYSDIFTSANGDRGSVPNVAILVSDGNSNVNDINTIPEAEEAKRLGITIYSVSLGNNVNEREMAEIASPSSAGEQYSFLIQTAADVDRIANELLDELCET